MDDVVCISDLHGHLPDINPCYLLVIAGDICPVTNHNLKYQMNWLSDRFADWVRRMPAEEIVITWGNHDLVAQLWYTSKLPIRMLGRAQVLIDELWEAPSGLRIYGLPWQLRFHDWAFNLDEPELSEKYDAIPECDIIVSHGPPFGYGDRAPDGQLCGSSAFVAAIDRCQPRLAVFGHVHSGAGVYQRGRTTLVNASHVDEQYRPAHAPYCIAV